MQQAFKIGTRGSPLALVQARDVRRRLAEAHGLAEEGQDSPFEIVIIKTSGDRIQDRALLEAGGKGLFTKEIEEALIDGNIDCAVHSMKDMPTKLPNGLEMTAILPREDPRDAWISPVAKTIKDLPQGAKIGTASLRRQAQMLAFRPDLEICLFRGNVDTRLAKLAGGEVDGTLLAAAGLNRLGRADEATALLSIEQMLPAVAQGAVGVEARTADNKAQTMLEPLNHVLTSQAIEAERAFLAELDGSCRTPIAGLAEIDALGTLTLLGKVLSLDGKKIYETRRTGPVSDATQIGRSAGQELKQEAGEAFFAELHKSVQGQTG